MTLGTVEMPLPIWNLMHSRMFEVCFRLAQEEKRVQNSRTKGKLATIGADTFLTSYSKNRCPLPDMAICWVLGLDPWHQSGDGSLSCGYGWLRSHLNTFIWGQSCFIQVHLIAACLAMNVLWLRVSIDIFSKFCLHLHLRIFVLSMIVHILYHLKPNALYL